MHLYLKILILFCGGDRIRQHNQKLVVCQETPEIINRVWILSPVNPPTTLNRAHDQLIANANMDFLRHSTGHCLSARTISTLIKQEEILHHSNNLTSTIQNIKEQVPVYTFRGDFLSPKPVQSTQRVCCFHKNLQVLESHHDQESAPTRPTSVFSNSKARYSKVQPLRK